MMAAKARTPNRDGTKLKRLAEAEAFVLALEINADEQNQRCHIKFETKAISRQGLLRQ